MKVKFLKKHKNEFGFTHECGWTSECTDPDGDRLIAAGICKQMPPDTRARRSELVFTECVQEPHPETKEEAKKYPRKNTMSDEMIATYAEAMMADAKVDYGKTHNT